MELWLAAAAALHQQAPWFWPMVGGVLGAVLGSFLTCVWHRLPRGLSLRQPPSHCPACRTTLGVQELIPILSWLWQRGRCRHCAAPIPWRSLWLEITCTAAGASLVWWLLP